MELHRDEFTEIVRSIAAGGPLLQASLIVATTVRPDLDRDAAAEAFATFASEVPGDDASTVADGLFGSGRLIGNQSDYYNPDNSVVPLVIERGLGIPISLSVIFIETAAHHGIDVAGVGMPGHFLTRSGDTFIDPFHRGAQLDHDGCQQLYQRLAGRPVQLPKRALDPVPPSAIVTRMLWNLRSIAEGRADDAMRHRVLALLSCCDGVPLQVHLSWASALAQRGAFGHAADAVESVIADAPEGGRERLERQVERWRARLN